MASGFTINIYEVMDSGSTHVDTSASALQFKNQGIATVYVSDLTSSGGLTDGQRDSSPLGTHGWPLAPGDTLRVPGGSAFLNIAPQADGWRAQVVCIREN